MGTHFSGSHSLSGEIFSPAKNFVSLVMHGEQMRDVISEFHIYSLPQTGQKVEQAEIE
jgi:hypothetical protein